MSNTNTIKSSDFIKIYRIEHRINRGGPFRVEGDRYLHELDRARSRHAAPIWWDRDENSDDELSSVASFYEDADFYRFGFQSMGALRSVFYPEDLRVLEENGYWVVELEVSERESYFGPQGQVCFIDPRLFGV